MQNNQYVLRSIYKQTLIELIDVDIGLTFKANLRFSSMVAGCDHDAVVRWVAS